MTSRLQSGPLIEAAAQGHPNTWHPVPEVLLGLTARPVYRTGKATIEGTG